MSDKEHTHTSEAEIAVHWQEESMYPPPADFVAQANMTDSKIHDKFSVENFPECFEKYADLLDWKERWHTVLDTSDAPCWKWFSGGKINASYNCIDRHLEKNKNKAAIHFVPERPWEANQHITYQELYVRVNEMAALLQDFAGLKQGDRVTLHLPMTPELPITMLACARIGVIHSQVFAGFSGSACADRIVDSQSRVLITMDGYSRAGMMLDHKEKADIACDLSEKAGQTVDKVLVWERHSGHSASCSKFQKDRDYNLNKILGKYHGARVEPVPMDSDAPLFLMYTSGTTGKPKGCQHSTGGYLAYAAGTSKYVQDIQPEDVYWCMADIGWITGHSYIVYGPLSLCASTVLYEGIPTFPDAARPWQIAQDLAVNIFHTAPTAVRALRKLGPKEPAKYDYHFKLMTTVGEPIEPEVWRWYYNVIGKGKAAIVDTWWQTETGGFLCSTLPAIQSMKPGSAGPGLPGIYPIIYDDEGNALETGCNKAGNLCIQNPWPGGFQTIWGDKERFIETYYARYCKNKESTDWRDWPYVTGDAAMESADGYYRILGRVDDVINVAGHRLGTKEIESAAMIDGVAEVAVVPVVHEIKGKEPDVYVSLLEGYEASPELQQEISEAICDSISKIARPRKVWIIRDMPKTRSGKIMRRVLSAISNKQDVGDIRTLANPEIVAEIQKLQG